MPAAPTPAKPRRSRRPPAITVIADPVEAAHAAHLTYVNDGEPGIARVKSGKGFRYTDADGQPIRDKTTIARIRHLAIPPAYIDVWISPDPDGHIQATGRDEKGRKQYRYHPGWAAAREANKFSRMIRFGEALPAIRQRLDHDLRKRDLAHDRVLAAVVSLLSTTYIRVGSAEYARENESYGLTTMEDDHAAVKGETIAFTFRGKSGKDHAITLRDRRLARLVKACQDLPGQHLFQWVDEAGNAHNVTSNDVNAYLKTIAGEDFTAKDFRTWGGTTLAVLVCQEMGECADLTAREKKARITAMIKEVAAGLGNTPTVAKKYYIHPAIGEAYLAGSLLPLLTDELGRGETPDPHDLNAAERAVLHVLRGVRAAAQP